MTLIIDATNSRLGRMATHAAKAALQGQEVIIVNCEAAIITGTKSVIMEEYIWKRDLGRPTKGPFIPRMPDRFVRRVIRSMLPYKDAHGTAAFKRVMCYTGTPKQYEGKGISIEAKPAVKKMTVKELCTLLGGHA